MSTGQSCYPSQALSQWDVNESNGKFDVHFNSKELVNGKDGKKEWSRDISDRLQWTYTDGIAKERMFTRVSRVSQNIQIVPFDSSIKTLLKGVVERVFTVKVKDPEGFNKFVRPPRPSEGHFADVLKGVTAKLGKLLPTGTPRTHDQFVESYVGSKRQCYQRALYDMRSGFANLEDDSICKNFVKFEKTDCTNKAHPVPRVISPRDPKYNIRVGRYLKHMEKPILRSIDRLWGHKTVVKGMNAYGNAKILREKYDMYVDPVAIGLDASRFDQHVSIEALQWEHEIYLKCFPRKKDKVRLATLLGFQLQNRCKAQCEDGHLNYNVNGTRMSGDMNTSLGNCLLMCSMMFAYKEKVGVKFSLANNGDDCVAFMERRDEEKFKEGLDEWFTKMGFTMAVEPTVDEFPCVEFCQTKPIWTEAGWLMCRNPHTAIVKDSTMLYPYNETVFRRWIHSVGIGGLRLAGQVPIFQDFYSLFVRSGRCGKLPESLLMQSNYNFTHLVDRMHRSYGVVHPKTRMTFWQAFDITPDEQELLESYYSNMELVMKVGEWEPRKISL